MQVLQQPAYVLHTRAWQESSLLLECLTPDFGRIGVIARGAKRPKSRIMQANLQPFQRLALSFTKRAELANLHQLDQLAPFYATPDQKRLLSLLYVNELVVRMTMRDDPNKDLFANYTHMLDQVMQGASLAWSLRLFERDFLTALGYALVLDEDVERHVPIKAEHLYCYIPEYGPVLLADHQQSLSIKGSDLLALESGQLPDKAGLDRLRRLMRGIISYYLEGRPLRAWQWFG